MLNFKIRVALIASVCIFLSSTELSVQAKPVRQSRPRPTPTNTTTIYQRAKEQLPDDWYALYRVIDRVARANGLDNKPWRIVIVPKYEINAFATEVNLLAVADGLLDQLAGDASAIACVVGHEMGHHAKRHIAVGEAEKARLVEQIRQDTEKEVLAEAQDTRRDSRNAEIGGAILRNVPIVGGVLRNESRNRLSRGQRRINEIVAKKTKELEQRLAEQSRQQEFEADEFGYLASARAGFEAEGCLRAMEVLARTSGAEFDTTHPAVPKRIEALKALIAKYPPQTLTQEGQTKISATQPLTYDLSKDKGSLRINSRYGSSAGQDIDQRFGQ